VGLQGKRKEFLVASHVLLMKGKGRLRMKLSNSLKEGFSLSRWKKVEKRHSYVDEIRKEIKLDGGTSGERD